MPHHRFFAPKLLIQNETVLLEEEEAHHLIKVMRAQRGEIVECFNGKGSLAKAKILDLHKNNVSLLVTHVEHFPPPACPLILAQAMIRLNRLDTIIEKGCELGMNTLWLYPGDLSELSSFSETQKTRMRHLLIAACKQCGQLYLPEISLVKPLSEVVSLTYPAFWGDLRASAPLFQEAWFRQPPQAGALFFVGPEKGFSPAEISILEKLGAQGVCLGPLTLRADTAPLAALTLMAHWTNFQRRASAQR